MVWTWIVLLPLQVILIGKQACQFLVLESPLDSQAPHSSQSYKLVKTRKRKVSKDTFPTVLIPSATGRVFENVFINLLKDFSRHIRNTTKCYAEKKGEEGLYMKSTVNLSLPDTRDFIIESHVMILICTI